MYKLDLISHIVMIVVYAQNGEEEEAIELAQPFHCEIT